MKTSGKIVEVSGQETNLITPIIKSIFTASKLLWYSVTLYTMAQVFAQN